MYICLDYSRSKKNSKRYYHNRTLLFLQGTRHSAHILIKLELYRQIFRKILQCTLL